MQRRLAADERHADVQGHARLHPFGSGEVRSNDNGTHAILLPDEARSGGRFSVGYWCNDAHTLGVFLNGQELATRSPNGEPLADDSFLVIFNSYFEPVTFTLPTRRFGARWRVEVATGEGAPDDVVAARAQVSVDGRALVLLRRA